MADSRRDSEEIELLQPTSGDQGASSQTPPTTKAFHHGGTIKFERFRERLTSDSPKFVKVGKDSDVLEDLLKPLELDKKPPQLVLTINGGAKRMDALTQDLQIALKEGLKKICATAKPWIITSGLNAGVAKVVGDAMREYRLERAKTDDHSPVLIGIATWGSVQNREKLVQEQTSNGQDIKEAYSYAKSQTVGKGEALLDPNHTHFILFDDGSEKQYNREIDLRNKFENWENPAKKDQHQAPIVQIVIDGGKQTIDNVDSTLKKETPTIIMKGSGRCADLICEILNQTEKEKDMNNFEKIVKETLEEYKNILPITDEEIKNGNYKDLLLNICKPKDKGGHRKLLHIFGIDSVDKDLDYEILKAAFECSFITKLSYEDKLKLAMDMDRCDVFKDLQKKGGEAIRDADTDMEKALKNGQTEFVKFFLDRGVSIRDFLTEEKLLNLHGKDGSQNSEDVLSKQDCCGKKSKDLLSEIGKKINRLSGDLMKNPYDYAEEINPNNGELTVYPPRNEDGTRLYTEQDLFFWALLKGVEKRNLIKIFWRMGKDHIGAALFACGILRHLQKDAANRSDTKLSRQLSDLFEDYQNLACDVLSKAYERDKERTPSLLIRALPYYGNSMVLSLANQNHCLTFMSQPAVQTKLDVIWNGGFSLRMPYWKVVLQFFFPCLIPCCLILPNEEEEKEQNEAVGTTDTVNKHSTSSEKLKQIIRFYKAPVTKFVLNTASNILFLLLMCYMIMVELKAPPISNNKENNISNKTTNDTNWDSCKLPRCISPLELAIWIWIFTLLVEEIRQILDRDQISFRFKLKYWWSNGWNKFDCVIFILTVAVVISRFALPVDQFHWIRYIYVFTSSLFFLRFMQTYYVNSTLGPKVVMVSKMLNDILFFLFIFIIFLLAYGTAAQALLYPNSALNWNLVEKIFYQPYFQIYGELNLSEFEELGSGAAKSKGTIIFFAIYLLLTNILLINLLIAMFGYTFAKTQEMSDKIWAYKRYALVYEYVGRPILPPPLNLFELICRGVCPLWKKCKSDNEPMRKYYKEILSKDENYKMSVFERQCMELVHIDRKHYKKVAKE